MKLYSFIVYSAYARRLGDERGELREGLCRGGNADNTKPKTFLRAAQSDFVMQFAIETVQCFNGAA